MRTILFLSQLAVIGLLLFLAVPLFGQNDSTFTVYLPKLGYPPDEEGQGWNRPLVWGSYNNEAYDDSVTIPNGRPIYALFVSGYSRNGHFDELHYYNFARHLMAHGAYVHYSWWNNLLAQYMERPLHYNQSYPGDLGTDWTSFTNPIQAQYKGIPGEDYQFIADAKRLLTAIRQNNPNAIIILVGHSMGGGAIVHLASQTNVRIDILAPIDPVNNRNFPWRFAPARKDYNWTRWRITRDNFLGYKARPLFCIPAGPWHSNYLTANLLTPCILGPKVHTAPTLKFRNNVVHLYHRWQGEFLFPFDYYTDRLFVHSRPPGGSTSQAEIRMKGNGESDPGGWPEGADPLETGCCPTGNGVGWPSDGHGEIVGYRGPISNNEADVPIPLGVRTKTSPNCGSTCPNLVWPYRFKNSSGVWVDPDALLRRDILMALDTLSADSIWQHEPTNPDLCLVSQGLIHLFNRIKGPAGIPGIIAGTVTIGGEGTIGATIRILNYKDSSDVIDSQITDENGNYSFDNLSPGSYKVMIVEPLGYEANQNYVSVTLANAQKVIVDFELTGFITSNNAKGEGYWKHQFNVYVNGRGHAQETEAELEGYINLVASRYNPHFSFFFVATDDSNDFQDWQAILSVQGNEGTLLKAVSHLSASVLNIVSLKLAQYEVVTEDSMTAGDVLTFVSQLLDDEDPTNDEFAKDLAEQMNEKQMIAAGLVPPSGILYRGSGFIENRKFQEIIPIKFVLEQNYPNPFNPSTTIRYAIPTSEFVTIKIFNILGQKVIELINEIKAPGYHELQFDATKFPSGTYIYQIRAGSFVETKKMILLR